MSVLFAWLHATRPLHLVLVLVPAVVGHLVASHVLDVFNSARFWISVCVVACVHLTVSFADAWADHRVRRTSPFGGAGKTIDRYIKRPGVPLVVAAAAAGLAVVLSLLIWVLHGSWPVLPLSAGTLALFWLHSLPPVRLARVIGSEPLQAAYIGLYLPTVGFAAQAAGFAGMPAGVLLPTSLVGLGVVFALTAVDVEPDQRSGRRTVVARTGPVVGRVAAVVLSGAGVGAFLFLNPLGAPLENRLLIASVPVLLWAYSAMMAGQHPDERRSRLFAGLQIATALSLLAAIALTSALPG